MVIVINTGNGLVKFRNTYIKLYNSFKKLLINNINLIKTVRFYNKLEAYLLFK